MSAFKNSLLKSSNTISEAISAINLSTYKIALVIDENGELLGTVTDGDIRRAIIEFNDLKMPVKKIMNKNYKYIKEKEDPKSYVKLMKKFGIKYLPFLDNKNKLKGIFSIDDLIDLGKKNNVIVVMAGGIGSRLRPLTDDCPKPMLRINDKPMLELILEKAILSGFNNFYFSVNYLKDHIKNYFGNGDKWNVNINYLEENKPLGTAGSLKLLPKSINEPILVMNGDVLTKIDYENILDFHVNNKLEATMCVREEKIQFPYGVVESEGILFKGLKEKPVLKFPVNAGVYVINPETLSFIKKNNFCDMPELFLNLKSAYKKVGICPIHEYWLDIGRIETFEKAKLDWQ